MNNITVSELNRLHVSFCNFRYTYGWDHQVNEEAAFMQYLKSTIKVDELFTLVKLGADKADCHMALFEKVDARFAVNNSRTMDNVDATHSLLWLAAKTINEHSIKVPNNLSPDLTTSDRSY